MTATATSTLDARGVWRRARVWLGVAGIAIVAALIALFGAGATKSISNIRLDPTSPAPSGAKALYQVLGEHGVTTSIAHSLEEVDAQLESRSTLVINDYAGVLLPEQYEQLISDQGDRLSRIVLLRPTGTASELAEQVAEFRGMFDAAGANDMPETFTANCELTGNTTTISNLGGTEFSPVDAGEGCFNVRAGAAVVAGEYAGVEIVVVGVPDNLTNDHIDEEGNAALGLTLLGSTDRLVWYVPSHDDLLTTDPQLGDYVPPWLTPVILLLLFAGAATVFWRGRRFGPLVAEQLPVTVPAAETVEGRARLYDHANARLRALDNIRIGTLDRLAALLGLGRTADAGAIADATAVTAGVPREHAHRVLLHADPASDAELVELANAAHELERRVRAAMGRAETDPRQPSRTTQREHTDDE